MGKKKRPMVPARGVWCLSDPVDISRTDSAIRPCGAQAAEGPCVLPHGHNMGQADVPWNHVSQVEKDRTMDGILADLEAMEPAEKFPDHKDDAWRKHYILVEENTKEWTPRPDLRVTALGCDRSVRLDLDLRDPAETDWLKRHCWRGTQRNISTMRELAQAILDACDFVEAVNPKWAEQGETAARGYRRVDRT